MNNIIFCETKKNMNQRKTCQREIEGIAIIAAVEDV